jgi:hypothetical protein
MSPAAGHEVGPDLLEAVKAQVPGIELVLREKPAMDVMDGIHRGTLDLGIALEPPQPHRLDGISLAEGTVAALLHRDLPISRKRRLAGADVHDLALVLASEEANPHLHAFALQFAERHRLSRIHPAIGSTTLPRAVYQGAAFVLWPTVVPARYAPSDLVIVPFARFAGRVDLWMLFRSGKLSPAASRVVSIARSLWPADDGRRASARR